MAPRPKKLKLESENSLSTRKLQNLDSHSFDGNPEYIEDLSVARTMPTKEIKGFKNIIRGEGGYETQIKSPLSTKSRRSKRGNSIDEGVYFIDSDSQQSELFDSGNHDKKVKDETENVIPILFK